MINFKEEAFHRYFQYVPYRSYNGQNLYRIFEKEKQDWGLRKSSSVDKLLEWVLAQKLLSVHIYRNAYHDQKKLFTYGTNDFNSTVSGIKAGSYLAYLSAMKLHGLSSEKAKTVYLNAERPGYEPQREGNTLSQDSIESAFASPQKESTNSNIYKGRTIMITNGKRTDRLGVLASVDDQVCYYYTDLERTLIDCVVRPGYAGGTKGVLKAFKKAKPKLDLLKLHAYLHKLKFTYPYEQCIGLYLDRAGYLVRESSVFIDKFKFDFYLAHDMEHLQYNKKWKIYYPCEF
jgi:predicted transcriptional regulator of viral defense system